MSHPQLKSDFYKESFLEGAVQSTEKALMVLTNNEVMKMPYMRCRTTLEKF